MTKIFIGFVFMLFGLTVFYGGIMDALNKRVMVPDGAEVLAVKKAL